LPGEKKNVLLVVRWPVGGIRTFLRYVYKDCDPDAYAFTVVAPQLEELRVLLEEDLAHLDITYEPLDPTPSFLQLKRRAATLLFGRRFDMVHSHGFTSGLSVALSAFLSRTTHLMTSHDVVNPEQFEGSGGSIKRKVIGRMFSLIDEIHSVSHDAQENLLSFFPQIDQQKCRVIPNGIEVQRFQEAAPRDLRTEFGLSDDLFLVGFMGRFMAQKGFRYLVEAMEILVRADGLPRRPVILTFGWGGFIREEQEIIREKGLEEQFRFLPFTANVAASIKGLDALAMPSLWEACGLLAMEVLACGTPLIATNCIGLREFVSDTPATVVAPRDGEALAQAIQSHMENNRRGEFQGFVETACRRYDVAQQVAEVFARYRALMA
jgi:glycosyltransferase involved in cell wall biosynthesis